MRQDRREDLRVRDRLHGWTVTVMATTKNPSGSYDPTGDRVEEYSNLSLQQVDEENRIDGIARPALHV